MTVRDRISKNLHILKLLRISSPFLVCKVEALKKKSYARGHGLLLGLFGYKIAYNSLTANIFESGPMPTP